MKDLTKIYRKVAVSEERKNRIGGNAIEFAEKYKRNSSAVESFTLQQMLREFAISQVSETEDTAQLKADKAELLEALENSNLQIEYLHEKFKETGSGNSILSKNKSLIQKHKQ